MLTTYPSDCSCHRSLRASVRKVSAGSLGGGRSDSRSLRRASPSFDLLLIGCSQRQKGLPFTRTWQMLNGVRSTDLTPSWPSVDQHRRGILHELLDSNEEQHRLLAVDDAVVVRQRDVHHRPDLDPPVHRDWSILNLVQSEDSDLRIVDDWRGDQRSEHTAIRDGERATCLLYTSP